MRSNCVKTYVSGSLLLALVAAGSAYGEDAPKPVGQAPEKPATTTAQAVVQLFDQPGVLTPGGTTVIEPSLQYSYSSTNRVAVVGFTVVPAVVVGAIDIQTVNRKTFIGALTARRGVTNRFELEAKLPYVYRNDDSVSRPVGTGSNQDQAFNATGNGIGDIEFGARYQLNVPDSGGPYYVAGLRVKTRTGKDPFEVPYVTGGSPGVQSLQKDLPTGSGFYGVQPSLSVIYPSDPAVFFGGINYMWNKSRDVNKDIDVGSGTPLHFGKVEPGDSAGFNFGMGMAINEKAAFSLGYEHTYVAKTRIDGVAPAGATSVQLANLLVGFSYRVNNRSTVNLSLGAGLTRDTPDTQITLRLPITF